ncbi:hypothetical protein [Dyadobacter frigoris]|uniref:Uncharacterized protein n=1 Tax=Dyadobacter frigoris TaxID=2576211 RepID=A0A4U6CPD3_9BACT|nr:hypothetical protein [Dyadobacter frigoris]TKT85986.1 hypothetical protein FDK13_32830 [Dyadobacter frigoris]
METVVTYLRNKLTFIFANTRLFSENYRESKVLTIINPAVIPDPGDVVSFEITEFTTDSATIDNFKNYMKEGLFFVEHHSKTYGKQGVHVKVIVHEEEDFKRECPDLYKRTSIDFS